MFIVINLSSLILTIKVFLFQTCCKNTEYKKKKIKLIVRGS